MRLTDDILQVAIFAIPIVFAITFHEAAHGYVARHFGDHTASDLGRVTLNPLKHIDPLGSILLPAFLLLTHAGFIFGWAKPVPVDPRMFRQPRRDMMWVAAAGPAMNLLLATLSVCAIYLPSRLDWPVSGWLLQALWASVTINLTLATFNILPIPPLDGSKVLAGLLPKPLVRPYVKLSRYGMLIVLGLFVLLPMAGLNIFPWLIGHPIAAIERPILAFLRLPTS